MIFRLGLATWRIELPGGGYRFGAGLLVLVFTRRPELLRLVCFPHMRQEILSLRCIPGGRWRCSPLLGGGHRLGAGLLALVFPLAGLGVWRRWFPLPAFVRGIACAWYRTRRIELQYAILPLVSWSARCFLGEYGQSESMLSPSI